MKTQTVGRNLPVPWTVADAWAVVKNGEFYRSAGEQGTLGRTTIEEKKLKKLKTLILLKRGKTSTKKFNEYCLEKLVLKQVKVQKFFETDESALSLGSGPFQGQVISSESPRGLRALSGRREERVTGREAVYLTNCYEYFGKLRLNTRPTQTDASQLGGVAVFLLLLVVLLPSAPLCEAECLPLPLCGAAWFPPPLLAFFFLSFCVVLLGFLLLSVVLLFFLLLDGGVAFLLLRWVGLLLLRLGGAAWFPSSLVKPKPCSATQQKERGPQRMNVFCDFVFLSSGMSGRREGGRGGVLSDGAAFPLLLGGAAWFPPSLGGVAFPISFCGVAFLLLLCVELFFSPLWLGGLLRGLLLLWVVLLFFLFLLVVQPSFSSFGWGCFSLSFLGGALGFPPRLGKPKPSSTTQLKREKSSSTQRGRREATPPNRRMNNSSTTQRRKKPKQHHPTECNVVARVRGFERSKMKITLLLRTKTSTSSSWMQPPLPEPTRSTWHEKWTLKQRFSTACLRNIAT